LAISPDRIVHQAFSRPNFSVVLCALNVPLPIAELAKRLRKHGFKAETEASITNKLKRGTFSATFFLACLAAMELEGVALEEI
jgi:hypothetical protein